MLFLLQIISGGPGLFLFVLWWVLVCHCKNRNIHSKWTPTYDLPRRQRLGILSSRTNAIVKRLFHYSPTETSRLSRISQSSQVLTCKSNRLGFKAFLPGNVKKAGVLLGVTLFLLFTSRYANGQVTGTFTSSTTWTCPAGVTSVTVECWGGGGGGGYARTNNGAAGGGGGGGAYKKTTNVVVAPNQTITITVGSGGTGGTSGGTVASNGGVTIFGSTVPVSANGGGAGGSVNTGNGTAGLGGTGGTYNGGAGAIGQGTNGGGGGGGSAGTGSNGSTATSRTGAIGVVGGGAGGDGGTSSNGSPGLAPGGGGGGGRRTSGNNRAGGNGANGQVKITWVCPSASISYSGTPFCVSTSTLQNVTLSGSSGGTFSSTPSGLTINSTTGAITPSTSAVGIYTVYYQIPADVDGLCSGVNATTTVTISPLLTPSVNITVAPGNSICVGTTVSFTATPTNGGSSPSYQWKRNGSNVGTNSPNYSNSSLSNGDQISCTLTSNASCVSSSTANSNVITMSVGSAATANAGAAMSPICIGGTSAALGGSVSGATGGTWTASVTGGTFSPSATDLNATWKPSASFTGTATLTLTTTGGTCTATASKTIEVINLPTVSCDKTVLNICKGSTTSALGGTYGGGASGAVWSDGGIGGTFTNNSGSTPGTTTWAPPSSYTGTAVLTLTSTGLACSSASDTKNVVVTTPSVGGTVSSDQTICSGSSPSSLTLSGQTGSVVKWQKATVSDFSTYTDISNTTTSLSAGALTQTTYFRAVVQNGVCSTANSSVATIRVLSATLSPATQNVCQLNSCSAITATGTFDQIIRWEKSSDSGVSWTPINKTINPMTDDFDSSGTFLVRAVLANSDGSVTCNSGTTQVVVSQRGSVSGWGGQTLKCLGQTITNLTVSPGTVSTWEYKYSVTDPSDWQTLSWIPISGTNTNTYSPTPTLAGYYKYHAIVSNGACVSVPTINATDEIQIKALPVVSLPSTSVCVNGAMTLSPSSGGNWISSKPSVASVTPSGLVTGLASGTVSFTFTDSTTGCSSTTTTVTVLPLPTVTNSSTTSICSGSSTNISLTSSAPSSFSWTIGTIAGGITGASSGSGSIINQVLTNPGNSTAGSVQYIVTPTSTTGSCAGAPFTITVTVNPSPVVTNSSTTTICSGSGSNISLAASISSNFSWAIGTISGSITGASASSGSTINQTLTNPSNTVAGSVQYVVTPTSVTGGCSGTPYTITVTVNPLPAVTSSSTVTICSGSVTGISLTASIPSNFSWTVGPITGEITGASGGSGSTINQTLTNPGNATAGTVKYIVTPTSVSGGCAGASFTITVTVNPLPVVTNSPAVSICNGNNTSIALTASVPSSFTWTIGTISGNITGASAGSGSTISQTLTNTDAVAGTVQYIVVPTSTPEGCTGSPFTITVTVNPLPTITLGTLPPFCAGASNFLIPYLTTTQAPTTFSVSAGTPALAGFIPLVNAPLTSSPLSVPLPAAVPPGTYQFIITIKNANGCVSVPKTIDVVLQDIVPPVINCPTNVTVSADATHCYASSVALGIPVTSDNCSTVSVTNNSTGSFPVGVTTVTWTATDVAGNKASCTQLVTVIDQTPPTAVCKNTTVSLNASGTATITASSVDNGSNDVCGIKSLSVNKVSFDCTNVGTNTVVLTVTDNSDNVSSCNAIVTVVDPIPPVARCKPYSVELNALGNATITAANIDNGSSDNCSFTLSVSKSTFDCTNVGSNSVTLSVTDAGGNVSTCTAVVTVYDHIAPVARCKDFVLNLQAGGTAMLTANDIDNGSTDNCSNLTKTLSKTTFNCSNVGTNTVTLTVTDAGGNSSSCTATVIVKDLTPPTAVCKNITAYLDNTGKSVITPSMVDNGSSDNCGGSIMLSLSKTTFDCTNRGTNTVILTVIDASGNSATCTSIVTIVDNIAPIATCKDYTLTVNAATGTGTLSASNLDGGSTDNCSIASYQISKDNVTYGSTLTYTCSDVGVKTVYFKVTDVAGNSSTCTSQVTIKSSLEITNISLDLCGFVFSQTVTGGSGTYSYFWDGRSTGQKPFGFFLWPTNTSTSSGPSLNIALPDGTYTIYLTVTDNTSGCSVTKPYTFIIDGSLGGTTTISSQACAGQTITYSTIATGSSYSWAVTNGTVISGGGSGDRTITVTWSSAASTGQIVATINLLGNLCKTIETNNVTINPLPTPAFSSYTATLCPGSTQTYTLTSSFASHAWTITGGTLVSGGDANQNYVVVKWGSGSTGTVSATVTNSSGCSATATPVSVSLVDNQKPVITSCPSGKTVSANFGLCYATGVELGTLAATDACTSQSDLNITNNAPEQFPIGNTTVTWTVSDLKGNTSTCTQIITVVDNQYPTITCQSNVTLNANTSCTATYDPVLPTYSDNCGTPTLTWKITQGASVTNGTGDIPLTSFNPGVTVVAYTVTDATGKSASCQFNVTVTDNTPPTIVNCPSTVTVTTNNGCTATGVSLGTLTATDNCTSQASLAITNNAPASYPLGKTLVTWTVTDATGLSATCTQEVNVTDNIAPTISCPSNISATTAVGSCTRSVFTPDPTTSDNCSVTKLTWSMTGATVSSSASSGINKVGTKTFSLGVTTITYVVTDASNNSATCSFTVTVTDNQAPTLSACPSPSSSYMSSLGLNYAILSFTAPTATDNCSSATLTWTASGATPSSGTGNISNAHFPVGNTVVTYQAVDASGNISTCQFTVIVNPNFPPDITCTSTTRSTDAGICTATFNPGNPTLISGDEPVSYLWTMAGATTGSGTGSIGNQTFNKGATTISWIASNVAGNDYCTQTITITDTEAPVVSCPSIPASVCVNGASQYTHSGTGWNATATDNCGSVSSLTYQLSGATAGNGTSLNGASFNVGNTTVVWTATDNSGNSSSCTYTVTVNSPPSCSITGTGGPVCPSSNNTFSGPSGMATYSWSISSGSASIGGAANQQSVSVTSGSGCNTSYVLSLTITDSNGCSSTCTKTVTVQDVTAPVITCPTVSTPVSVTSGSTYIHSGTSWDATATDTCSGTITYSASLTGSTTNTSVSTLNGFAFNIGTTHVVWRATDGCSNSSTCTFDVVVLAGSDLKLTKTGPATASVGSAVTYTLTVENLGPTDAPVVTISDALPASFSNRQFSTNGGSSWTSWTGSYQLPSALANGASQSILVRGAPDCSVLGTVTNTASVALSPYTDLNLANNTSTVVTTISDTTAPTYSPSPTTAEFCVINIQSAVISSGTLQVTPAPASDYALFKHGTDTSLDLNMANATDNCCSSGLTIRWEIHFSSGQATVSGTGQPSTYATDIQLWGDGTNNQVLTHEIWYWIKDCNSNEMTSPIKRTINIQPRPKITTN